jgi:hypothetical protein
LFCVERRIGRLKGGFFDEIYRRHNMQLEVGELSHIEGNGREDDPVFLVKRYKCKIFKFKVKNFWAKFKEVM